MNSTMSARLEPVYLANVLLFVKDLDTIKAFPIVSKKCQVAMLTLKTNPGAFCLDPRTILKYFPNINTMVVNSLSLLSETDLPDTVASLVVKRVWFTPDESEPRYADRVVEVRGVVYKPANLTLFPRLERLVLDDVCSPTLPSHRLKFIRVYRPPGHTDPLAVFPPECAEKAVFVYKSLKEFSEAKARQLPPHVHVFCNTIGEGVRPEDFLWLTSVNWWNYCKVAITDKFTLDDLRAFNDAVPVPHREARLWFPKGTANDVSFLTRLTLLNVWGVSECTVAIPTSVVKLKLFETPQVSISGTENLTYLNASFGDVTTTPSPRLREFWLQGMALSEEKTPIGCATALSGMTLLVGSLPPAFRFPAGLASLCLHINDPFDTAVLTPLTRLSDLLIDIKWTRLRLDLSGLCALTKLDACGSLVTRLPTSLVECLMAVRSGFDFSALTNLTSLGVRIKSDAAVTFPTQLKKLYVNKRLPETTNIGDVALEEIKFHDDTEVTKEDLERLPKTLRRLEATLEPYSLREHLGEMFPLLEKEQ